MSAYLRCRPGDLALVVNARNAENIGLMVRVVCRWPVGKPGWNYQCDICDWEVEALGQPILTRNLLGEPALTKTAPVVDSYLQPIRGQEVPTAEREVVTC